MVEYGYLDEITPMQSNGITHGAIDPHGDVNTAIKKQVGLHASLAIDPHGDVNTAKKNKSDYTLH